MRVRHTIDVAISYAGEDRERIEPVVRLLLRKKLRIFYDQAEREHLWGRGLSNELAQIYGEQARYILAFISPSYLARAWTTFELQAALARIGAQKDDALLIVKVPPVVLPEMVENLAYLDLAKVTATEIVEALVSKLRISTQTEVIEQGLSSPEPEERVQAILAMASFGDDRFGEELSVLLLTDASPEVRARAAWALDGTRSERAIPALISALNDTDWNVRSNAGWALVHLGEAARTALRNQAGSLLSGEARDMAAMVLERI